jgi:nitroimidazol reductase NimA-like FMN-containing flavoprotein (pyridoxamine 5'-phosphate oxidase superfamily)
MKIQELTKDECVDVLKTATVGRLACAHDNQPYVVPMYFAYREPYLYGFTTPGEKVTWMRANPLVCVEWDKFESSDEWISVIVFGKYEELPDVSPEATASVSASRPWSRKSRPSSESAAEQARLQAHGLLHQRWGWWQPACASAMHRNHGQPLSPIYFRILIERVSGRRALASPGKRAQSKEPLADRRKSGLVSRLLHFLSLGRMLGCH